MILYRINVLVFYFNRSPIFNRNSYEVIFLNYYRIANSHRLQRIVIINQFSNRILIVKQMFG